MAIITDNSARTGNYKLGSGKAAIWAPHLSSHKPGSGDVPFVLSMATPGVGQISSNAGLDLQNMSQAFLCLQSIRILPGCPWREEQAYKTLSGNVRIKFCCKRAGICSCLPVFQITDTRKTSSLKDWRWLLSPSWYVRRSCQLVSGKSFGSCLRGADSCQIVIDIKVESLYEDLGNYSTHLLHAKQKPN